MRIHTLATAAAVTAALWIFPFDAGAQADLLDDPTRPAGERERDAGTRPLEIYRWMEIEAGMTVVDFIPSAGYNSHLLAGLVGESGSVLAAYTSEQGRAALEERFGDAGLAQVRVLTDLADVPDGSVDRHVTVRNLHDLFIPEIVERFGLDPEGMLSELHRTLAGDGFLCVVDARTPGDGVDGDTHRISESMVIRELEARGFELVERSELLAAPGDDPASGGFPTRWNVDRMLLKFRKAAG